MSFLPDIDENEEEECFCLPAVWAIKISTDPEDGEIQIIALDSSNRGQKTLIVTKRHVQ